LEADMIKEYETRTSSRSHLSDMLNQYAHGGWRPILIVPITEGLYRNELFVVFERTKPSGD